MGKNDGFLNWPRQMPASRDASERIGDYREFQIQQSEESARRQAGRCMDCGIPFCQQGCPLGNIIPDWNDLVYRGRWEQAYRALSSTNNFPEFTGRLCPAPCEGACTLTINTDAVTIEQTEREIIERAFDEGWVLPQEPTARSGRRVAVVGSGPAGLAAAQQLVRAGHNVTVYEKSDRIGGLLRYGIPDFKMEKHIIDRRLEQMKAEGVEFQTGVEIGADTSWKTIHADYDAVLVAIGAGVPRDLKVPGRDLDGVHFALTFLEQQNRVVAGDEVPDQILATGRDVIILGGGDTGSDCVGTSHRQGAKSVTQIELMPAPPETRRDTNPWPQWPLVFRTSSSQKEGGRREFAFLTKELIADNSGRVCALRGVQVQMVVDESGRTRFDEVDGTEVDLPCDLLILAMGYVAPDTGSICDQLGVDVDGRGNIRTVSGFETSQRRVLVAGDAKRGASLIVWAISDGREAARQIDAALARNPGRLPTRGMDRPFGGR